MNFRHNKLYSTITIHTFMKYIQYTYIYDYDTAH